MEEAHTIQSGNIVDQNVSNTNRAYFAHHCFPNYQVVLLWTTSKLLSFMQQTINVFWIAGIHDNECCWGVMWLQSYGQDSYTI